MAETETPTTEQKPFLRRGEDFESLYANHSYFQPSEWDLKITFGEVDNDSDGTAFIAQHTSIALPWLQAKLMHYFLSLQLASYEMSHGRISVPESVMPAEPPLPEGTIKDDPRATRLYELVKKTRDKFVAENAG